ncbi:hypothetical protein [Psychromonas algicola]|uniref:hypothetical protein n=1 Tax=Psychromonas algicola TaxID=2555642 RepID=UPI001067AE54|nr:hypothetical protein [Psychromonas sp. RZ5]TEW42210.1 hypothetical protein E2R67_16475 [Psychromonas sp. RZ5]
MNFESELKKVTFDEYGEVERDQLYDFIDKLELIENKRDSIPYIFNLFENNFDKEFGEPGPLVHFIEEDFDYFEILKKSIEKQPTLITIKMVNRIINGVSNTEKEEWLSILESISNNHAIDNKLSELASEYLSYQRDEI